jgi:dephospho-CoA kinase
MRPGTPVYEEVVRRFGRGILRADGEVDRPSLARIVFNDKARLQELTSITHPAVIKAQEQWMDDVGRADPHAIAVVEAALIYEAGLAEHFDKIIVVTCTAQNKLERLSKRMGVDLETARLEMQRRSAAQIPDDEKARRADYVVDNSGDPADTQAQLQEIAAELRRLANTTGAQRRSQ